MAERRSCRCQAGNTGVCPRGARVRRTVGVSMKPASSRKARWAWRTKASRTMRPEVVVHPTRHLLVVPLPGARLWLPTAEAQASLEDDTDVFGVVANAEVASDQAGDAVGGPQVVGPTVLAGPLEQEVFDLSPLLGGELGFGSEQGLGGQSRPLPGQATPAMHGGFVDAQDPGDERRGLAAVEQFDGATAAAFQFSGGSKWSWHTQLYGCPL